MQWIKSREVKGKGGSAWLISEEEKADWDFWGPGAAFSKRPYPRCRGLETEPETPAADSKEQRHFGQVSTCRDWSETRAGDIQRREATLPNDCGFLGERLWSKSPRASRGRHPSACNRSERAVVVLGAVRAERGDAGTITVTGYQTLLTLPSLVQLQPIWVEKNQ